MGIGADADCILFEYVLCLFNTHNTIVLLLPSPLFAIDFVNYRCVVIYASLGWTEARQELMDGMYLCTCMYLHEWTECTCVLACSCMNGWIRCELPDIITRPELRNNINNLKI